MKIGQRVMILKDGEEGIYSSGDVACVMEVAEPLVKLDFNQPENQFVFNHGKWWALIADIEIL